MNGFEFDGCILYGIQDNNLHKTVYDLLEYNEIWYEHLDRDTHTLLGETNLCWYTYNKKDQNYNILDIPSADILNKCNSLNEMLNFFFDEINI